jgi:hypothetical protein
MLRRISRTHGVLELVLHPTSYQWRFVSEDGALLDKAVRPPVTEPARRSRRVADAISLDIYRVRRLTITRGSLSTPHAQPGTKHAASQEPPRATGLSGQKGRRLLSPTGRPEIVRGQHWAGALLIEPVMQPPAALAKPREQRSPSHPDAGGQAAAWKRTRAWSANSATRWGLSTVGRLRSMLGRRLAGITRTPSMRTLPPGDLGAMDGHDRPHHHARVRQDLGGLMGLERHGPQDRGEGVAAMP